MSKLCSFLASLSSTIVLSSATPGRCGLVTLALRTRDWTSERTTRPLSSYPVDDALSRCSVLGQFLTGRVNNGRLQLHT